jgi:uncharacterized protein YjbJ (UPF0337 family)
MVVHPVLTALPHHRPGLLTPTETDRRTAFRHGPLRGSQERMSNEDKIKNKIEDLGGRAKEAIGKATGDHDTKNEGRADQAKSSLKDAGEKVKDAFKK